MNICLYMGITCFTAPTQCFQVFYMCTFKCCARVRDVVHVSQKLRTFHKPPNNVRVQLHWGDQTRSPNLSNPNDSSGLAWNLLNTDSFGTKNSLYLKHTSNWTVANRQTVRSFHNRNLAGWVAGVHPPNT